MVKKVIITEQQYKKVVDEAGASAHFKERRKQRLNSLKLPSKDIIHINRQFKKISRTKFDPDKSFAYRIIKFEPDPSSPMFVEVNGRPYYRVVDENGNDSTGDELWAVIRNNEIVTFFIRKSIQTADEQRAKEKLRVDEVIY
jgi:hypothetical protein